MSFVFVGCVLAWRGADAAKCWTAFVFFGGCGVIAAWDLVQARMRRAPANERILNPHDRFQPLVIRRSVGHFFVYAVATGCFGIAGLLIVWSEQAPVFGWIGVIFGGGCTAVFCWQILDRRPRLVIDGDGICDRTLGVGKIAWDDIEGAYLQSIQGVDFICLVVRDPEVYLARLSSVRRKVNAANHLLGFMELNLNLGGTTVRADDVLQLIYEHIRGKCP